MGVPGLWEALAPARTQQNILANLADDREPLIIAIDISIWMYQCAAADGGINSSLRTFYYRLCRLVRCGFRAIFIFDGAERPRFKRGKELRGTINDFRDYKVLINAFGFHIWEAPGEAEAEAACLQKLGLVDIVISDDVDTLLFGATHVYRNWAAIGTADNANVNVTHTSEYHAHEIEERCHLDPAGMVLIALLSGGDYFPAGLPGCGIKTAVQAAQAGYGASLVASQNMLATWRSKLQRDLQKNESGHFTSKHPSLVLPDAFPSKEILEHYICPRTSSPVSMLARFSKLVRRRSFQIDYGALQFLTQKLFRWNGKDGLLRLRRSLAVPTMTSQLLRQARQHVIDIDSETATTIDFRICGSRQHESTDKQVELRLEYSLTKLVPLDSTSKNVPKAIPQDTQEQVVRDDVQDSSDTARMWILHRLVLKAFPEKIEQWNSKRAISKRKDKSQNLEQRSILDYYAITKPRTNVVRAHACAIKEAKQMTIETTTIEEQQSSLSKTSKSRQRIKTPPSTSKSSDLAHELNPEAPADATQNSILSDRAIICATGQCPDEAGGLDTDLRFKGTRATIKTYFKTKKFDGSSAMAPCDSRRMFSNEENVGDDQTTGGGRPVVLRKSLPGHWRLARPQDSKDQIHEIHEDNIIDLSQRNERGSAD